MSLADEETIKQIKALTRGFEGVPLCGCNLAGVDSACGPKCAEFLAGWESRFEASAAKSGERGLGRILTAAPEASPVTVFSTPLSMLVLPPTLDRYLSLIGDKSRNIIRKAERAGYSYRQCDGSAYTSDIFEIRNSTPMRLGRPIPEYWRRTPGPPLDNRGLCSRHRETFYGVFQEAKLVAYCTLRHYGEIAQFNQILGHYDHLKHGVMYLLMKEMVRALLETEAPLLRAVNYLHPDAGTKLGLFKIAVGCLPTRTVTTLDNKPLALAIEAAFAPAVDATAAAAPKGARPKPVALAKELLFNGERFVAAEGEGGLGPLLRAIVAAAGEAASVIALRPTGAELGETRAWLARTGVRLAAEGTLEQIQAGSPAAVVVCDPGESAVVESIGKVLASYAACLEPGGCLLLRFVADPARAAAAGRIQPATQAALAAIYGRRFRAQAPSLAELATGFRGSAFQAVGLVDDEPSAERSTGLGWLALRKIAA